MVPSCIQIKQDGVQCGSPAKRGELRCPNHLRQLRETVIPRPPLPLFNPGGRVAAAKAIYQAVLRHEMGHQEARNILTAIQVDMQLPEEQELDSKSLDIKDLVGFSDSKQ